MGDIQWLRPYLRLTKGDIRPLEDILAGDSDPLSPRMLTPEALLALKKVEDAIMNQHIGYYCPDQPLLLIIFSTEFSPTGLLWQNPVPLLWVHFPIAKRKVLPIYPLLVCQLIMMGLKAATKYFGKEPDKVIQPYDKTNLEWLALHHPEWAVLTCSYRGDFDTQLPSDKLIQFFTYTPFIFLNNTKLEPIPDAWTVFIDGSKNGKAAYVLDGTAVIIDTPFLSAQLVELYAALTVLQRFEHCPVNIYSDSRYVVGALQKLEMVPTIQPQMPTFDMFCKIQKLIRQRDHPFFIGHIRAHTDLPGPLALGNELADAATRTTQVFFSESQGIAAAQEAHRLHHLNAQTLRQKFLITREQAREIVKSCKNCLPYLPDPHLGVNPRGLVPGQLWQMDVTHLPTFGKLKYVHVTIDTFSGFIVASAHMGEAAKDVIGHMMQAMATLGQPASVKTDNGPGYTSSKFKQFCATLGIKHITGIPYNPQGQGIVERAHQTLKNTINKLRAQETLFPHKGNQKLVLAQALFVLNFLTLDEQGKSAADRHWHPKTHQGYAKVLWKDPITGLWSGPDPVLIWGKGSAAIYDSKEKGARWLPVRLVKPFSDTKPAQGHTP